MIKVLLDTSVFISSVKGKRKDKERTQKAECLLNFLKSSSGHKICYSERTKNELKNDNDLNDLSEYKRLNSHLLNEVLSQSEVIISNCATVFDDDSEVKFGDKLEEILPDKRKKSNKKDRGIYGDAFYNGCQFLIHENPKDFNRFSEKLNANELELINLLNHSCEEVIQKLNHK